jgi:hypothetical protein
MSVPKGYEPYLHDCRRRHLFLRRGGAHEDEILSVERVLDEAMHNLNRGPKRTAARAFIFQLSASVRAAGVERRGPYYPSCK